MGGDPGHTTVVLLAHPDDTRRDELRRVLVEDHAVVEVADGDALSARLEGENGEGRPDVVVAAVTLPGLAGDQLLTALAAGNAKAPPRVLLLGPEDPDARVRWLAAGADDVVAASCPADEVRHRVPRLLTTVRAQHRAERAERTLERFASMVSHDLRSPLASIRGYAELLEQGESTPEQRRRFLERIHHQVEQALAIIDELRGDARPRAPAPTVPLDGVVRWVRAALDDEIERLAAGVRADEGLPAVRGPRTALRELVHGLVSGALQRAPDDRRLEVRVGADPPVAGRVVLRVEDNGVGIDGVVGGRAAAGDPDPLARARAVADERGMALEVERDGPEGTSVRVSLPAGDQPADPDDGG